MINYDKLMLDVWIDGSIESEKVVVLGVKILIEYLNIFVNLIDEV